MIRLTGPFDIVLYEVQLSPATSAKLVVAVVVVFGLGIWFLYRRSQKREQRRRWFRARRW